jgi:hypothetical protein
VPLDLPGDEDDGDDFPGEDIYQLQFLNFETQDNHRIIICIKYHKSFAFKLGPKEEY